MALLYETTTEDTQGRYNWFGFQLDLSIFKQSSLTIFSGARKAGKSCLGGVCIYRPEFEGLEASVSSRF